MYPTFRLVLVVATLISVLLIPTSCNQSLSREVPPPDAKGPFDVGYRSLEIDLPSGHQTIAHIWYPIDPGTGTVDVVYRAIYTNSHLNPKDHRPVPLSIPSPLDASASAPIADGRFPLIVNFPGGNAHLEPANAFGLMHTGLSEQEASHGFIVVSYTRRAFARGYDAKAVIDAVIAELPNSVDENAIGISGASSGSIEVLALAAGTDELPSDNRIKAAILVDGAWHWFTSDEQVKQMVTPYLMISGSLSPQGTELGDFYSHTQNVTSKRHIALNHLSHIAAGGSNCDLLDAMRNASLVKQRADGVRLIDPLTGYTRSVDLPGGDPAGEGAYVAWNLTDFKDPTLGSFKEFCAKVGVGNALLDTDSNCNGTNDSYTGMDLHGNTILSSRRTNEIISRYSIAFFKTHLVRDDRYVKFLTPDSNIDPDVLLVVDNTNSQTAQAEATFYHRRSP